MLVKNVLEYNPASYDTDNSGEIDHHEMARIIHSVLDGNIKGDAEKYALNLIKMIDEDGDITSTETEFIRVKHYHFMREKNMNTNICEGCMSEPELKTTLKKIVEGCKPPLLFTQASYY